MHAEQSGPVNGIVPSTAGSVEARSELDRLRATSRRQAQVIDTLSKAVSALRGGAAALKAENADLRAAHGRAARHTRARARAPGQVQAGEALDTALPSDVRAPGAARIVVAAVLGDRVSASVLRDAQLVVSELVTNSVRHSGARATSVVVVRVHLTGAAVRLEVADSGGTGVVVPRPPDLQGGGGVGLNLVQMLSERWGVERVATSGTRVWAHLPRAPLIAEAYGDVSVARAARNGRPTSGREAPRRRRSSAEGAP